LLQDSLNTYIVDKLNENTQKLVFKGDYLFMVDNGKFIIKEQEGFSITKTKYIPIQIEDWNNTTQPFERIDLQDIVAPISFAIRQSQLADGLEAIEEFRLAVNGTTDTIDGLNVGFRVGQPSPPSSPLAHGGEFWIIVQVTVALSAGKLTFGNAIEFKMAKTGQTLKKIIYSSIDVQNIAQTDTNVDDYKVGIVVGKITQTITIKMFYEALEVMSIELLNALWQGTSPNQVYDISLKYSDTVTKLSECRITSVIQHIENGVPIGFDLTLNRYNG